MNCTMDHLRLRQFSAATDLESAFSIQLIVKFRIWVGQTGPRPAVIYSSMASL